MAFGSILDGPDQKVLTQLVESAISSLIEALADTQVRIFLTLIYLYKMCNFLKLPVIF